MTLNTLFLPLLGGFLFYGFFYGTSHRVALQSGQVLLLWSAAIGLTLLLTARGAVYLLREVINDELLIRATFLWAVEWPAVIVLSAGFGVMFVTVAVKQTILESHKANAVFGIVCAIFAMAFVFKAWTLLDADPPPGLNLTLYTTVVVMLVAAGAYWFANFGAIPWGEALIRISAAVLAVVIALQIILEHEEPVVNIWQSLTKPIAQAEAAAGLGSAFAACVLGAGAAWLANLVYSKGVAEVRYALGRGPSQLERLFYLAASQDRMVILTMEDRKVYVGTVERVAMRGRSNPYVALFPLISGYRTEVSRTVKFTNFYQEVYNFSPPQAWKEFQKVLPMQSIASAGYYDQQQHDLFCRLNREQGSAEEPTPAEENVAPATGSPGVSPPEPTPVPMPGFGTKWRQKAGKWWASWREIDSG